jgi:hypothetical protein
MDDLDFWEECISIAADECELSISKEQLRCLAESVSGGHENYGMAFYSPPDSDRYAEIEREWERKYKDLEKTLSKYQRDAEVAVKQALRVHSDANISIGEYGEVLHHAGRTTRIQ